jgi:hypothetical protein
MTVLTPSLAPSAGERSAPARRPGARAAWLWGGSVFAIVFIAAGVVSMVGDIAYQAIPARERVFNAPVHAVTVDIASGSVAVERGSGSATVVDSSGTRGLSFPTDVERVAGTTLVLRSHCGSAFVNNFCNRNYIVKVDPSVSVAIVTGQGDVTVNAIDGPLTLNTGEGAVTVRRVSGTLRAITGQGDISATDLRSQSSNVRSGEGNVELSYADTPRLTVASSSQGDVTVEVPRGPSYQVDASSSEGDVSKRVAVNSVSRHIVHATSGQGDVTVRYRKG